MQDQLVVSIFGQTFLLETLISLGSIKKKVSRSTAHSSLYF